MKSKVPAMILSGGDLADFGGHTKVIEYRIWIHGQKDKYRTSKTLEDAYKLYDSLKEKYPGVVEPPLAVVWDSKRSSYREVPLKGFAKDSKDFEKVWKKLHLSKS